MRKEIIDKDTFLEIMEDIKRTIDYQEGLNDFFRKNDVDGFIYQPDCISSTIRLLHIIFDEKDIEEWISYFCFDLDFGKKYKDGSVLDENGKKIKLETFDDLYTLLSD